MTTAEAKQLWVVEYSDSDDAFHVDTMLRTIESNLTTIIRKIPKDYKIIGLCKSIEEAHQLCDMMKQKIRGCN